MQKVEPRGKIVRWGEVFLFISEFTSKKKARFSCIFAELDTEEGEEIRTPRGNRGDYGKDYGNGQF